MTCHDVNNSDGNCGGDDDAGGGNENPVQDAVTSPVAFSWLSSSSSTSSFSSSSTVTIKKSGRIEEEEKERNSCLSGNNDAMPDMPILATAHCSSSNDPHYVTNGEEEEFASVYLFDTDDDYNPTFCPDDDTNDQNHCNTLDNDCIYGDEEKGHDDASRSKSINNPMDETKDVMTNQTKSKAKKDTIKKKKTKTKKTKQSPNASDFVNKDDWWWLDYPSNSVFDDDLIGQKKQMMDMTRDDDGGDDVYLDCIYNRYNSYFIQSCVLQKLDHLIKSLNRMKRSINRTMNHLDEHVTQLHHDMLITIKNDTYGPNTKMSKPKSSTICLTTTDTVPEKSTEGRPTKLEIAVINGSDQIDQALELLDLTETTTAISSSSSSSSASCFEDIPTTNDIDHSDDGSSWSQTNVITANTSTTTTTTTTASTEGDAWWDCGDYCCAWYGWCCA